MAPATWDLAPGTWHLQPATCNLPHGIWDFKSLEKSGYFLSNRFAISPKPLSLSQQLLLVSRLNHIHQNEHCQHKVECALCHRRDVMPSEF
jgi:hypothetical protein